MEPTAVVVVTKCVRCNRTIKNPRSVINGMGPVCFAKSNGSFGSGRKKKEPKFIPTTFGDDIDPGYHNYLDSGTSDDTWGLRKERIAKGNIPVEEVEMF